RHDTHRVAGEAVDDDAGTRERDARRVERPSGVQPVGVADEALLAERELLAADAQSRGRSGARADLDVCEPRVDDILKGRPGGLLSFQKHARALPLDDEA